MPPLTLFVFALTAVLLNACGNPKGYTITGQLTGIPDSTMIRLYSFNAGEDIDSVMILNGHFRLQGTLTDVPDMFSLTAQMGKEFIYTSLLIGNENLTIRGDRSDFPHDLTFSGSKFQAENARRMNVTKVYDKERNALVKEFFSLTPEAREEREKEFWGPDGKIRKIDEATDSLRKAYIKSHSNTYAGLIELGYLKNQFPRDTVEKFYSSLSPELKESRYGKAIDIYLNVKRVETGDSYYDIAGNEPSGKALKLSDVKTDYILLDFTSIGCGPCRKSGPELREIDSLFRGQLTLVSISMDKSPKAREQMIKEDKITWPYLWNGEGFDGATSMAYGVRGIPQFVLIGPERTLVDQWGGYDMNVYGKLIERIDQNLGITR